MHFGFNTKCKQICNTTSDEQLSTAKEPSESDSQPRKRLEGRASLLVP